IVHQQRQGLAVGSQPVDAAEVELERAWHTEVRPASVAWVGKVNGPVALHHHVVGAIQLLVAVVRGEHADAAINLGAGETTRGMLAGDEAAFVVPGEPVRLVAGLTEGGNTSLFVPAAQVVTRHIAEQEVALARVPQRTFREDAVTDELFEAEDAPDNLLEASV